MKNDKMYDLMTAVCRSRLQKCCGPKKLHLKVTESYSFLLFTHTIITVKSKYPQLTCYKFIYNNKKKQMLTPQVQLLSQTIPILPSVNYLNYCFNTPLSKKSKIFILSKMYQNFYIDETVSILNPEIRNCSRILILT